MQHWQKNILASILISVLITLLLTAEVAQAASPGARSWKIVPSPNVPKLSNNLYGVAAIAKNNIWSVGQSVNSSGVSQTLTEQWNGKKWSIVASPNPSGNSALYGIARVPTSSTLWAVGAFVNSSGVSQTLIEQWNGTKWSVVTSPNVGTGNNILNAVAAVSATNIWAVGHTVNSSNVTQTLTEQWNGTKWSIVASPNPGSAFNTLNTLVAISASNIWAAGDYYSSGTPNQTLIEHWNGKTWSVVASPNVASSTNYLWGTAAVSATNVWTVGYIVDNMGVTQTLTEQWNGTKWSIVPSLNPLGNGVLYGVTLIPGSSTLWAVGYFTNYFNVERTLIEYWNGTGWADLASPSVYHVDCILEGVVAISTSTAWTVGYAYNTNTNISQTLTEFY